MCYISKYATEDVIFKMTRRLICLPQCYIKLAFLVLRQHILSWGSFRWYDSEVAHGNKLRNFDIVPVLVLKQTTGIFHRQPYTNVYTPTCIRLCHVIWLNFYCLDPHIPEVVWKLEYPTKIVGPEKSRRITNFITLLKRRCSFQSRKERNELHKI